MAIGITKNGTLTVWEVPLQQGEMGKDNEWLVSHLRQLANKIETENPNIINIGLKVNNFYKSPELFMEFYEKT